MKTEPKETQTFVSASGNLLSGSLSLSLFVSQGGWRQKKKARGGQWKRKVSFPIFHRPFLFFLILLILVEYSIVLKNPR